MVRRTPLSTGQKYGDIIKDGELSPNTIARMLESGTLVRVATPPLSELPDWDKRAGTLAMAGVFTVTQLIEANVSNLAKSIKRPAKIIKQWQDEAIAWLNPPPSNEPG
jgi:hypothetical protein